MSTERATIAVMARLWERAIRPPPDDVTPNPNDPASVPPSTVGPDQLVVPGDPHGVTVAADPPGVPPTVVMPSAWSGWPAEWWPPLWSSRSQQVTDLAWVCVDINSSALASMPPYLVNAAGSLSADWLTNPDPDVYYDWHQFAKSLFWDYQACGEAFVLATSYYSTGWPARFHVVPPWYVNVEMDAGTRRYMIGSVDVTRDMLHIPYNSTVDDAHGHGPLEAVGMRITAANLLAQYATGLVTSGGIPTSVLEHPEEISPEQAMQLKADWVTARQSSIGEPAVLSGGIKWSPTQMNAEEMALVELSDRAEGRIADALGVPRIRVGLPTSDSMTYSNVSQLFDMHWREGLRPKAYAVTRALSGWALPRGTTLEVNQDTYVQPGPLERAQTYQILAGIIDPVTGTPVLSVEQIQQIERFTNATPQEAVTK